MGKNQAKQRLSDVCTVLLALHVDPGCVYWLNPAEISAAWCAGKQKFGDYRHFFGCAPRLLHRQSPLPCSTHRR